MMKQTLKELRNIARAEYVPFSRVNKNTLIERIQHHRDTVGTMYRKDKKELKRIARNAGLRRYGKLNKNDLIDNILFYSSHIKPKTAELQKLTRDQIRNLAMKEGLLNGIGRKKSKMIKNLSHHRFRVMRNTLKDIVEDIANKEYEARRVEGAFNDGYTLHRNRSKGVDEGIVTIEDYLNKYVKRHILKLMKKLVKNGDSYKFQLNLGVEFVSRKGCE